MGRFRLDAPALAVGAGKAEIDLRKLRDMARSAWDKGEALAASGDLAGAVAWVGRANRMAPSDQNILFSLAWLHLRARSAERAAALFGELATRHGTREAFSGWIAALLSLHQHAEAAAVVQRALASNAADQALGSLAARVAVETGAPGWCGLRADGRLLANVPRKTLRVGLDGDDLPLRQTAPGVFRTQGGFTRGQNLEIRADDVPLLGSPLSPACIFRLEGFVETRGSQLSGWAWFPGAPERDPELTVASLDGVAKARFRALGLATDVAMASPLARPRSFAYPAAKTCALRVLGPDGRDLLGSPALPATMPPPPQGRPGSRRISLDRPADVVIPVYRGLATTLACIASVLDTVPPDTRIWVVNDASPEPELAAALRRLAKGGSIRLIHSGKGRRNRGFPAAANAGLRAAKGRHVALLNSDTLVAPGWLEILREAACSAPDIGTATPISNDASILSYPGDAGQNPVPDRAAVRRLAALAARVNRGRLVDIPTAHGFCMFIRRDCLNQTGFFDETVFAQGYGEENDFSERAAALGWRHVAVPEVFVAHVGGASFGASRSHLLARNLRLLEQRHPGYGARVADWIAADPLIPARRRLDVGRWRATGRTQPVSVLLISHGKGGGTARIVAERAAFHRAAGFRPIVLRPKEGFCEVGDLEGDYPNLRFSLPGETKALRRLIAAANPVGGEVHHLLGHDSSVMDLFTSLGVPYDVWVHDYAWFCARLSFITGDGRFCGEAEVSVCNACVSQWGYEIDELIPPAKLRRRSAAILRKARAVIAPSDDVARRISRHVPGLSPVVQPWEKAAVVIERRPFVSRRVRRVAVIGAIGIEKGYEVLLACAKDAAARQLTIEFVVVGYTVNDEALLETGKVFITGAFAPGEARELIRAQSADLAFLPSIWPETWCYALSDAWAGGLPAVVFDIGTPAARIRAGAGLGWVLPLGLPASRVNDALFHLAKLNTAKPLLHVT